MPEKHYIQQADRPKTSQHNIVLQAGCATNNSTTAEAKGATATVWLVPIGAQYQHFQFGSIEVVIVTKRKETMALPQQLRGFRMQLSGSLRIGRLSTQYSRI